MSNERTARLSKLELARRNSKWVQKPNTAEEKAKIDQARRDLWLALNDFCLERGAQIVSPRFANPVRLEIPLDSPLADKLKELGHDLIFCEQTTRIGAPVSGQRGRWVDSNRAYSFRTVDVFELRLPK
jgi:hypothetical protein